MALVLKDRVKETTTTTGTGTLTLGGAVTGYQSFSSAIGNTNTTYYAIYLDGGSEWEVGIGTVSAGALSRDTILASSNAGSAVNFSAGQKTVWCDYPAGKAVYTDASGSISEPIVNISGVTGHISSPDYIEFDTGYSTPLAAGQLGWDGNNTLGIGMAGGNVTQHIGEDQFFYCKATSAITKGEVVMFTGAVGASGVATGAPATGITDGTYIMGIAAESIALNGFGLVQSFGTLRNVNTTGYADGDILWYDPSVTGGLTKTKPVAPNVKVQMAAVINGGPSGGGTILIRINAGSTLGGSDSNAQITSASNGQILTYDGTNAYWKNTTLTAGTGITTTPSSTGVITVTNTAPDQTVSLSSGTGISTSGTYPSFTITNTAPDQTVSLTGGTGINTSGTYPNFTITNTSPSLGGDVVGPSSATDNAIARYDGTTGKLIQNSAVTIDDTTGSLNFTATGARITGDFSNATAANRVAFQTSTTNSNSFLQVLPNGTATQAGIDLFNLSDPTNAARLTLINSGSEVRIASSINGTGTYLPLTMYTGGSERLRIDNSGNVGIGITSPSTALDVLGIIEAQAALTQDAVRLQGRAGGTSSYSVTLTPITLTASRTLTLPDASTTVVGTDATQTLTNKRITPRVSTTTSSATPTINTDNVDVYGLTAQAADITSFTTNLSGTPTDGQKLQIYIVGTAARAITWGASFEASTQPLPTTTVSTNRLDVGFVWNAATSKWRCVAVA